MPHETDDFISDEHIDNLLEFAREHKDDKFPALRKGISTAVGAALLYTVAIVGLPMNEATITVIGYIAAFAGPILAGWIIHGSVFSPRSVMDIIRQRLGG